MQKNILSTYTVAKLHAAQPKNCVQLPINNFFKLLFVSLIVHLLFVVVFWLKVHTSSIR